MQHVAKNRKYQFASEVQHIIDMCNTTVDLIKENKFSHFYGVLLDSQYMYYDTIELSVGLEKIIDSLGTCSSKSFGQFESVCQVYWSEKNQTLSKEWLQFREIENLDELNKLNSISTSVLNLQQQIGTHMITSAQNSQMRNKYIENIGKRMDNMVKVQSKSPIAIATALRSIESKMGSRK